MSQLENQPETKQRFEWVWLVVIVFAVLFSVLRFFQPSHPLSLGGSYQAFAHLYVGGLIGAYLASWKHFYLVMAIALSAVELIAFFSLK